MTLSSSRAMRDEEDAGWYADNLGALPPPPTEATATDGKFGRCEDEEDEPR